ncbi:UNVERIFIED_CONTAM: hypothetical protein Slati_3324300 [Sesamum latifolium]|uniref:Uncharacterized protein n=1 Tax=Sesamum latifolium TaxID=2727402 RepID=A0AAW2UCB3_9LAMI
MAKLAFAKGIWSYVCKMGVALRKYSDEKHHQLNSTAGASMYIQKVRTSFVSWHSWRHQIHSR